MNICRTIEHTLLKADAQASDIEKLCDSALEYSFAGVCINPIHVKRCAARLHGSKLLTISVIGFPLGASSFESDSAETFACFTAGAHEVDMVIPIGAALAGDYSAVCARVQNVVNAADGLPVKAILESAHFNTASLKLVAQAALDGGAQFLKTSTGFGPGGATTEHVKLLHDSAKKTALVKASGGIKTLAQAKAMLAAGAARLGTSSGISIVKELSS